MSNFCLYLYKPQAYLDNHIPANSTAYKPALSNIKNSSCWGKTALVMVVATIAFGALLATSVLTCSAIVATAGGVALICALMALRGYHLVLQKIQNELHVPLSELPDEETQSQFSEHLLPDATSPSGQLIVPLANTTQQPTIIDFSFDFNHIPPLTPAQLQFLLQTMQTSTVANPMADQLLHKGNLLSPMISATQTGMVPTTLSSRLIELGNLLIEKSEQMKNAKNLLNAKLVSQPDIKGEKMKGAMLHLDNFIKIIATIFKNPNKQFWILYVLCAEKCTTELARRIGECLSIVGESTITSEQVSFFCTNYELGKFLDFQQKTLLEEIQTSHGRMLWKSNLLKYVQPEISVGESMIGKSLLAFPWQQAVLQDILNLADLSLALFETHLLQETT